MSAEAKNLLYGSGNGTTAVDELAPLMNGKCYSTAVDAVDAQVINKTSIPHGIVEDIA